METLTMVCCRVANADDSVGRFWRPDSLLFLHILRKDDAEIEFKASHRRPPPSQSCLVLPVLLQSLPKQQQFTEPLICLSQKCGEDSQIAEPPTESS
ncbi:hypothetical protein C0J52_05498 [Blattella germanica]|nr:hypothetical protein C0J52_05498 [Blattella germanica]